MCPVSAEPEIKHFRYGIYCEGQSQSFTLLLKNGKRKLFFFNVKATFVTNLQSLTKKGTFCPHHTMLAFGSH